MAAAGAAMLALTACSGDGGDELGADAAPAEVVAAGLDARLENGAAFTLSMDGDLEAIAERAGEPVPPELADMMEEGLVSGAFAPEQGFAMTLGADGGFFEMRAVDEALYLRLDLEAIASSFPEAGEIPPPDMLRGQIQEFGLPPDIQGLAEAALDGQWVGITGLSEEALTGFAESMGGTVPSSEDAEAQQEALTDILEEKGLLDGETITERYLTVEGDGPTYLVTVMARELVETLNEVAAELEANLGAAAGADMGELPDTADVPETLSGFSVTVEDGTATAVGMDMAMMAESAGEPIEEIEPGELVMQVELDDLGDQLAVPGDATTIDFESFVTAVMGAMFMGGMGDMGAGGDAGDLGGLDLEDLEQLEGAEDLDLEELLELQEQLSNSGG